MKHWFDVEYVGDDSHTHWKSVWAANASDALKKAKGPGVDYVLHAHKRDNPLRIVAYFIGIVLLIVGCAYLGIMISRN